MFISTKNDENVCECGLQQSEHGKSALKKTKIKNWNSAYCTTDAGITDAFGDLCFTEKIEKRAKVT